MENKDLLAKMHSSVSRVFCYVMLILWSFVCGEGFAVIDIGVMGCDEGGGILQNLSKCD